MRGEAMAKCVAADSFGEAGVDDGLSHGFLQHIFVEVMSFSGAGGIARIGAHFDGGEEILPGEFAAGGGIFFLERGRQPDVAVSLGEVFLVDAEHFSNLLLKSFDQARGKRNDAILITFSFADGDLVALEVDIFDS